MNLIVNAVNEMVEALKTQNPWNNVGSPRGVVNIRMNQEVALGADKWQTIAVMMVPDLEDLVVNGDVDADDPLYKAIDGEKKLGKSLTKFVITSAVLEETYVPRKESTEIQIFFRIYAEFDGEEAPIREVTVSKDNFTQR